MLKNDKMTSEMKDLAEGQIRELQKEISFDTKDYPIEVLVDKFRADDFYIPEYQRKFVWDNAKKVRFIESVLLGLPIPFMFFSDNEDGRCEIIDGAQRTQTLEEFLYNDLMLDGLEKLTSLNGFKFTDLPEIFQRKFKGRTLRIIVLADTTTIETRQDIFNRINTGGTKAIPSEIRRGSYAGCSVYCLVDYWFDEFVRDTGLIAFFDSLGHIGGFTAFAVYEHIVGHEDAVPVVVSVHGVVTAYY